MLNDSQIARRADGRVEVRTTGLRVRWDMNDLVSSDGHTIAAGFVCAVRGLDDPNEQKMLEEAMLSSRNAATAADVAAYFSPPLRSAASGFVRRFTGDEMLTDEHRTKLLAVLMDAGKAVAFGCGLELLPPAQLEIDSPTLRQARRETLLAQETRRRSDLQSEQIQRSAEIFRQFQAIRASAPELSTSQVLSRVGISDQAELIRSLLMASARQAPPKQLWAVAGPYLIRITTLEQSATAGLIPLPPTLGPLRSIGRGNDGEILIGARSGVMSVNPADPEAAKIYTDPGMTSQLGFNGVVQRGDEIWATHGEAGLVSWNIHQPGEPVRTVRPESTGISLFAPHNLCVLEGSRLLLSSANQVLELDPDAHLQLITSAGRDEILAIIPSDHRAIAVHASGQLCAIDLDGAAAPCVQKRSGRIIAAAPIQWIDETRVLLATEDGPILCASFDDEMSTHYVSPHQSMRIVTAAGGWVAAASTDRQRLILWHSWDGRKPAAEVHIAGLAKHRIADIAFV